MNNANRIYLAITAVMIAALACNLPAQNKSTEATPTVAASQVSKVAAPTGVPTPTTQTVSVSTATNCRTGPDPSFPLVMVFQPGASAQVVGKYSPTNYWVIDTPTGGTCWLWGAYATVQGNTSTLAEMAPPAFPPTQVVSVPPTKAPTNAPAAPTKPIKVIGLGTLVVAKPPIVILALKPAAPASLHVVTACQFLAFPAKTLIGRTDSLDWPGVSDATGYTLYLNGSKIADTAGTNYVVTFNINASPTTYGVAAYNTFGASGITTAASACP